MQFNSFKTGGVVYKVCDTEFIKGKKGEFQKREIWIEVPTQNGMASGTEIFKFETIFDETAMLDNYTEGRWVDIVFRIDSRKWTNPENQQTKVFNSFKLIDMKEGPNPFAEGKDLQNKPDDLSNTIVSEMGDRVKDWANEEQKSDSLFDPQPDDLPF